MAQLVNQTELSRDVALPQPTVHRWLNLLEISYLLVRLPAYAVNRTKRLIESPKVSWGDTGVALHLSETAEVGGAHLENLVLDDLLAWRDARICGRFAPSMAGSRGPACCCTPVAPSNGSRRMCWLRLGGGFYEGSRWRIRCSVTEARCPRRMNDCHEQAGTEPGQHTKLQAIVSPTRSGTTAFSPRIEGIDAHFLTRGLPSSMDTSSG
jgi:hypothetical protein